jgi:hypothetical protein
MSKIIPPPTKHTETFFSRLLLYNKKKENTRPADCCIQMKTYGRRCSSFSLQMTERFPAKGNRLEAIVTKPRKFKKEKFNPEKSFFARQSNSSRNGGNGDR